eukprot:315886-Hanusia_phi.AAC.3
MCMNQPGGTTQQPQAPQEIFRSREGSIRATGFEMNETPAPFRYWLYREMSLCQLCRIGCGHCKKRIEQQKEIAGMSLSDVKNLFKSMQLPKAAEGVDSGGIDGKTLLDLYHDASLHELFVAPSPDGLGLTQIQFKGRFMSEMKRRVGPPVHPSSS